MAGGYAVVSIRTGWVNTHYPTIFMKSNLNAYIDNNDKLKPYLAHCYKENISILPPSVNESKQLFTVHGEEEGIRYGLRGLSKIKSLSNLIFDERNARGLFTSYQDFVERMSAFQKLNKGQIESLIYSGALDEFEGTRKAKISMIPQIMQVGKNSKKSLTSGQITIFDFAEDLGLEEVADMKNIKTPDMEEFDKDYILAKEKEFAGAYITGHPLDDYQDFLKKQNILELSTLKNSVIEENEEEDFIKEEEELDIEEVALDSIEEESYVGQIVSVSGIVTEVEPKYDKKGNMFMIFSIEDRTGDLKLVCFNKQLAKNQDKIMVGKKVVIKGKFDVNDFGPQIIVDTMFDLEHDVDFCSKITVYSSEDLGTARLQWSKLLGYIRNNADIKGNSEIIFVRDGKEFVFPEKINLNLATLTKLQLLFGKENCKPNNSKKVA